MRNLPKLNAFQLKVIALVCMTLDHLAAFGSEIPLFAALYTPLRIIGRIAAPVFLFLLVQSARHTQDRKRFLLRLYLSGAGVGLFTATTNFLLGEIVGYSTSRNIIFTFFYAVLYIHLTEMLLDAVKIRRWQKMLLPLLLIALSFLPNLLYFRLMLPGDAPFRYQMLVEDLRDSFLPSTLWGNVTNYGLPFVVLGVVLYFFRTPKRQTWVFAVFCLLCALGTGLSALFPVLYMLPDAATYFNSIQLWMVLAIPFLCLYNGEKGSGSKWFFYVYYPVHRYIIRVIASFFV